MSTCNTSGLPGFVPRKPPETVYMAWISGLGFISSAIKRFDRIPYMGKMIPTEVSHVLWLFEWDGPTLGYESHLDGGIQVTPYQHIKRACKDRKIDWMHRERMDISPQDGLRLWNRCVERHHKPYNVGMIIRYYFWIRLLKRNPNQKPPKWLKNHDTCNTFVIATAGGWGDKSPIIDETLVWPHDYSQTPEQLFRNVVGEPSYVTRAQGVLPPLDGGHLYDPKP